jgi:hypothetical protein
VKVEVFENGLLAESDQAVLLASTVTDFLQAELKLTANYAKAATWQILLRRTDTPVFSGRGDPRSSNSPYFTDSHGDVIVGGIHGYSFNYNPSLPSPPRFLS